MNGNWQNGKWRLLLFVAVKDEESFLKPPPVLPGAPARAVNISRRMHKSEKARIRSRAPTRSTRPVLAGMRKGPLWASGWITFVKGRDHET